MLILIRQDIQDIFILYGRKAKNLTYIRRKIPNINIKEQFWVNKVHLKIGPSLIANASGMS